MPKGKKGLLSPKSAKGKSKAGVSKKKTLLMNNNIDLNQMGMKQFIVERPM